MRNLLQESSSLAAFEARQQHLSVPEERKQNLGFEPLFVKPAAQLARSTGEKLGLTLDHHLMRALQMVLGLDELPDDDDHYQESIQGAGLCAQHATTFAGILVSGDHALMVDYDSLDKLGIDGEAVSQLGGEDQVAAINEALATMCQLMQAVASEESDFFTVAKELQTQAEQALAQYEALCQRYGCEPNKHESLVKALNKVKVRLSLYSEKFSAILADNTHAIMIDYVTPDQFGILPPNDDAGSYQQVSPQVFDADAFAVLNEFNRALASIKRLMKMVKSGEKDITELVGQLRGFIETALTQHQVLMRLCEKNITEPNSIVWQLERVKDLLDAHPQEIVDIVGNNLHPLMIDYNPLEGFAQGKRSEMEKKLHNLKYGLALLRKAMIDFTSGEQDVLAVVRFWAKETLMSWQQAYAVHELTETDLQGVEHDNVVKILNRLAKLEITASNAVTNPVQAEEFYDILTDSTHALCRLPMSNGVPDKNNAEWCQRYSHLKEMRYNMQQLGVAMTYFIQRYNSKLLDTTSMGDRASQAFSAARHSIRRTMSEGFNGNGRTGRFNFSFSNVRRGVSSFSLFSRRGRIVPSGTDRMPLAGVSGPRYGAD